MFQKILLASDGSECALKAARVAADLATKYGSAVTVLHVFATPAAVGALAGAGVEIDQAAVAHYADEVHDSVARRTGEILAERLVQYDLRQEMGHPAETIIQLAEVEHYDLIVLGSRGLSGVQRFLLGSVSDRVARHSHCPVLIVK